MRLLLPSLLLLAAPVLAQGTIDTIGGTSSSPSRSALAKGNVIAVEKSSLLLQFELFLTVPSADTLTFFRYRHHSQTGSYVKDWSKSVKVPGNSTPQWYSSGTIAMPVIEGNHYIFGVSWTGTVTYNYNRGTSGQKFSFGSWYSGRTPTGLPNTVTISGVDVAQYYMRFNTVPYGGVVNAGTPCKSATAPNLVGAEPAKVGGQFYLDVTGAQGNSAAVYFLSPGPTLPKGLPIFGCQLWISPGAILSLAVPTNASGVATLKLPIPNDNGLTSTKWSWQAISIEAPKLYFTNATAFTL